MSKIYKMTIFLIMVTLIKTVGTIHCDLTNNYYVKDDPVDPCRPCPHCVHGSGPTLPCGSELVKADIPKIDCKPCIPGKTYSDKHSPESCKPCRICAQHEIVSSKCTTDADTNCSSNCEKDYYLDGKTHNCQPCSPCCNDTKDKVEPECIAHGMQRTKRCSVHRASECTPTATPAKATPGVSSTSAPSTKTTGSKTVKDDHLGLGLGLITPPTSTSTTPSNDARISTPLSTTRAFQPLKDGNRDRWKWFTGGSVGGVFIIIIIIIIIIVCYFEKWRRRLRGTSTPGIECCEDGTLNHYNNPTVVELPMELPNECKARVCNTCNLLLNEVRLKLLINRKDYREGEKCILSSQMWNKTNDNQIVEYNKFDYTWYKDGAKIKDQHLKELTFEQLKGNDFGTYECFVGCKKRCAGINGVKIKSDESIFLNVLPGPGRSYKKLAELSSTITEDIARDLSKNTPLIGNWTTVAEHYRIPNGDIKRKLDPRSLKDGDYESAKYTLEIINALSPDETVYDFCIILKSIKQNAIVKYLKNDLICQDEGTNESSSHKSQKSKIDSENSKGEQEEPKVSTSDAIKLQEAKINGALCEDTFTASPFLTEEKNEPSSP